MSPSAADVLACHLLACTDCRRGWPCEDEERLRGLVALEEWGTRE